MFFVVYNLEEISSRITIPYRDLNHTHTLQCVCTEQLTFLQLLTINSTCDECKTYPIKHFSVTTYGFKINRSKNGLVILLFQNTSLLKTIFVRVLRTQHAGSRTAAGGRLFKGCSHKCDLATRSPRDGFEQADRPRAQTIRDWSGQACPEVLVNQTFQQAVHRCRRRTRRPKKRTAAAVPASAHTRTVPQYTQSCPRFVSCRLQFLSFSDFFSDRSPCHRRRLFHALCEHFFSSLKIIF